MTPFTHCLLCLSLCVAIPAFADPDFSVSTFDSGTDGWEPDNPWTTSDVNGITSGNNYLAMDVGAALGNRGSKMTTYNPTAAWTGDYQSAGVTSIRMNIANWSSTDTLDLRIALGNESSPQATTGTWWLSSSSIQIAPNTSWFEVFIPLSAGDMTKVSNLIGVFGNDTYQDTLGNIQSVRILSSALPIAAVGDNFVGLVGIDNVRLVPENSQFSLIAAIGGLTLAMRRRRRL
tara:strand:+ start:4130 stop:4825 length:696 start_codon:yes stop_codon:yes gene_type:complete